MNYRKTDPLTRAMAADRIAPFKGSHEDMVVKALARHPGTVKDIAQRIRILNHYQVGKRISDLIKARVIIRTNKVKDGCSVLMINKEDKP